MFSTIRRKSGCSENFTPIISLDRHYNSSEKIHQTTSTTANIETMVPIRHPNNDILPRRTDTTSPKNPLNTLFSKYKIKPITKMITNHSGTPSTIIFHLFSNIDSIRLNDSSYSAISFFFISASGKILFNSFNFFSTPSNFNLIS